MKAPNLHLNLLRASERQSSSPVRLRVMLPILAALACVGCLVWWGVLAGQLMLVKSQASSLQQDLAAKKAQHGGILAQKAADLEKQNAALRDKVAALENKAAPYRQLVSGQTYVYENGTFTAIDVKPGAPITLYFDCGSAKLSAREKAHLEYFTNNLATADTKVEVNGYADKATGSAKTNQALSEKRAKAVVELLKKAGMPEKNIECKANGGVDIFNKPAYKNRVVTIEVK